MMKTMKISKYLSMAALGILALGFNSCENGNQEFPDYEGGTTVYYPYQYIERSVVLGNDESRDNTDDNNHVLYIVSTMGGAYNGKNITLNVDVDNSLCDNLYFEDGVTPVKPMPSNYYTIPTKTVAYNGKLQGRLQVKLEDAFFADPDCAKNTYVIPVRIKEMVGADSILSGSPAVAGTTPVRTDASAWSIVPKDYILYCVRFMNPWDGYYFRRGTDKITENGQTHEVKREGATLEKDEVSRITTKSLKECNFEVSVNKADGSKVTCNLKLTFDDNGNCTVTSDTEGMTASGSGKFVEKGAKLAWGNKDRDILTLNYKVDFGSGIALETTDQFVAETRGNTNGVVQFSPQYIKK